MGIGGSAGVEETSNEARPRKWQDDLTNVIEAMDVPIRIFDEIGLFIVIGLLALLGFLFLWVYITGNVYVSPSTNIDDLTERERSVT